MFRHFTGLTMLNSGSDHLIFMRGRNMFWGLDIFYPDTILSFYFHMSHIMRKTAFCICENKDIDQLRGTTKLIQSLYLLHTKCPASSHLMWLYSLVCVGPGQNTRRPVFSQRGSYNTLLILLQDNTKRTMAFDLSWIFFSKKKKDRSTWIFYILFFGKATYPPHKNQMVAS